jgi:hypothetical protein
MQTDIAAIYQRSLPDFVRVLPDGFQIRGEVKRAIDVTIHDDQVVRRLWHHGKLACQSLDGFSALATGKACRVCRDQSRCVPQIALYILMDETPFRIALNYTSSQNYLEYRPHLLDQDNELRIVVTQLTVVSRATWGEVQFRELF